MTEVKAKTILTPQNGGALSGHYNFSLNPYAGCAFKCSYCYVPKFPSKHKYDDWGNWVEVKTNAAELIRKERALVFGSKIFFSSATDPYQYLELKYRLSRACLTELLKYSPAKITMHTRSHLILQDLPLLQAFGERLSVGVSITTDSDEIGRIFEPMAPSISRRLALIAALNEAGINVFASIAPLLPHDPEKLVQAIKPHAKKVWIDQMSAIDTNTRKDLLAEYSDFFQADNYDRAVAKLTALLKEAGLVKPRV
ncbi:MAG: radical SAM protein [Cyanobacteria bacterium SZAS TMP-1]|nr:radical SAM protein [Cyanobacteria bacterium SZAS TMP-1]